MPELWLIRHAPTDWNAQKRIQGSVERPLSEDGRVHAARYRLPVETPSRRWFVSPRLRARETADIMGLTAIVDPRLREMSWGEWEGECVSDLVQRGDLSHGTERLGLDFRPPGGETPRETRSRLAEWLGEIARESRPVGAITHHGLLRAALSLALDWDMTTDAPARFRPHHLHVFDVGAGGSVKVIEMNVSMAPP